MSKHNLQEQAKQHAQDLLNVRVTLCEEHFLLHYDELKEDIPCLEKKSICEEITYNKLNDTQFVFSCTFIGKFTFIKFEYDDGWMCTVTSDRDDETIISECENINKFCSGLVNLISS